MEPDCSSVVSARLGGKTVKRMKRAAAKKEKGFTLTSCRKTLPHIVAQARDPGAAQISGRTFGADFRRQPLEWWPDPPVLGDRCDYTNEATKRKRKRRFLALDFEFSATDAPLALRLLDQVGELQAQIAGIAGVGNTDVKVERALADHL